MVEDNDKDDINNMDKNDDQGVSALELDRNLGFSRGNKGGGQQGGGQQQVRLQGQGYIRSGTRYSPVQTCTDLRKPTQIHAILHRFMQSCINSCKLAQIRLDLVKLEQICAKLHRFVQTHTDLHKLARHKMCIIVKQTLAEQLAFQGRICDLKFWFIYERSNQLCVSHFFNSVSQVWYLIETWFFSNPYVGLLRVS